MTNKLEPVLMVAEIDYDAFRKNEEDCKNCDNRFKCWTNRTLVLSLVHLSISRGLNDDDKFKLSANVPSCFQCGNMTGSTIKIISKGAYKLEQEITGIILGQTIMADETNLMRLDLVGSIEKLSKFPLPFVH